LPNQDAVAQGAVFYHRVRADKAFRADAGAAEQLHKGLDDGIRRHFDVSVDHAGFRPMDGYALGNQPVGGRDSP
jgi:hypothetical protein